MSKTVAEAALFASRLPEEDVEVPGVGAVRIRALSRAEVLEVKTLPLSAVEVEQKLLAAALVAPRLTEKSVGKWQAASKLDEIETVVEAVMRLSGMTDDTAKEAVKSLSG